MPVITVRVTDSVYEELVRLVKSGEFRSISDVVRVAISEFLSRRRYPWRSRRELREYLALSGRTFRPSGEIIDLVREEEES